MKHVKGIQCQRTHLVLTRKTVNGCQEIYALTQTADDILASGETSCQQDGIDVSTQYSRAGSDVLCYMINHGVEYQSGMFVAILFDTADDFLYVVGAKMGIEACLSGNALQELPLCILSTEAETDEVGCRQRAGTLWRERSFAVEGIIGINSTSVLMNGYRDASTHVADYQVQILIPAADLRRVALRNGSLIQGMPDTDAVHQW